MNFNHINKYHWFITVVVISIIFRLSAEAQEMTKTETSFQSAKPVWPAGREKEMNLFVGFRAVFEKPDTEAALVICGSSRYKIYLNGEFLGTGPARGPHGFYRVDRWPLSAEKLRDTNLIAIEVVGYNVNSYYLLDQPAFLQAEVLAGDNVIVATGASNNMFTACVLKHHMQKVQRYSSQRTFIEYYRLGTNSLRWMKYQKVTLEPVQCAEQSTKKHIPRRVSYPDYNFVVPKTTVSKGTFRQNVNVQKLWEDRSLVNIGPAFKGYPKNELTVVPSIELQKTQTLSNEKVSPSDNEPQNLKKEQFQIFDFGTNLTGLVGLHITCSQKVRLYLTFDEILQNEDINFRRLRCVNSIGYELEPGTYKLESFEPYTLRYLKVMVMDGDCTISHLSLREVANDQTHEAEFDCSDPALVEIFNAARQTFRQNATDIFMDCPSRERAGWLCDSFFTARVALDLTGNTTIEKNMYENYLLPDRFEHLPAGMLPMCYPADHPTGRFIPNWAMWFVVQLEEYLARSGDQTLIDTLEPKVLALLDYFQPFENELGLLENLKSWIFIEWSAANKFVQDVNYPSNMLYAHALGAAGRLYHKPELLKKAEQLRKNDFAAVL